MLAKLDKDGVAVTLVRGLSCKVRENIKVNYKTGAISTGYVRALGRLGLLTRAIISRQRWRIIEVPSPQTAA